MPPARPRFVALFALLVGTESAGQTTAFLSEPSLSARFRGLAGSAVAAGPDATISTSNAAAMAGLESFTASLSVMNAPSETDLVGQDFVFAAPVRPIGLLGLRFANREVNDLLEGVTSLPAGFEVYDRVVEAMWARSLSENWFIGVKGRVLWSRVLAYSTRGHAADLGIQGQPVSRLRLGISSENLISGSNADETAGSSSANQARAFHSGLGVSIPALEALTFGVYGAHHWIPSVGNHGASVGIECALYDILSLRGGYGRMPGSFGDALTEWTFGIGARIGPVGLDLARRTGAGGDLGGTTYATLTWGGS